MTGGSRPAPGPDPFRVLVVCTANICRSPVAEVLLAACYGGAGDVLVTSAGTQARAGEPLAPAMAALLDVDTSAFRAHQLTQDDALGADLVLTMTRAQRAVVVSLAPAALRRTFTLREFADLVGLCVTERPAPGGSAADRLAHLTAVAPRARSRRSAGVADDIDDPYGKDAAAHRRAVAEIADAVTRIAAATTPAAG